MRPALALVVVVLFASPALARGHAVRGYTTKRGTYVEPHHASNPNHTKADNYSTRGNANPYTGAEGTKSP